MFLYKNLFFFNIFCYFNPNHAYWNQRRLFSGNLPGMLVILDHKSMYFHTIYFLSVMLSFHLCRSGARNFSRMGVYQNEKNWFNLSKINTTKGKINQSSSSLDYLWRVLGEHSVRYSIQNFTKTGFDIMHLKLANESGIFPHSARRPFV